MRVFKTKSALKAYLKEQVNNTREIGFVPTMGALHQGHISLIEESVKNNALTIASIFVNPTQFDKQEDLEKYPRTIDQDLTLLEQNGCNAVFVPSVSEIYANDVSSESFDFDGLENEMEGRFRSGHFNGVGTIVKSFFEIINPTRAYFGEKDFQQLQIIKKMVEKNNLMVEVIGCPIYREANGLAMSSRNERLTLEQRKEAAIIYKVLQEVQKKFPIESPEKISSWVAMQFENSTLFELEYFFIADEKTLKNISDFSPKKSYRAFIAVYAESVRLIDNLSLNI